MADRNVAVARGRFEKSFARITEQVEVNRSIAKERIVALEWCRANGNPHLGESDGE